MSNGTSASVSDMNCTNNTSTSIVDGGISNTNTSDHSSALTPSVNSNSGTNTSHIQHLPVSGSSGPILSGASFNNAVDARPSDLARENLDSNNVTMDHQSS